MPVLNRLEDLKCNSSLNNIITFSRVRVEANDKEEIESYVEEGISPRPLEGKIMWEQICGSSYDEAIDLRYIDSTPDSYPNMVTMPPQDALLSVDYIKSLCPAVEGDVYIQQYVNPDKYQVILFANSENPSLWYGFIALTNQITLEQSSFSLKAVLEMVYVRPEFRGMMLSAVMVREVGRLLSEQTLYTVREHEEALFDIYVSVIGQGVTPAGKRCLNHFDDGLHMHLNNFMFDDINVHHSFEDEY